MKIVTLLKYGLDSTYVQKIFLRHVCPGPLPRAKCTLAHGGKVYEGKETHVSPTGSVFQNIVLI